MDTNGPNLIIDFSFRIFRRWVIPLLIAGIASTFVLNVLGYVYENRICPEAWYQESFYVPGDTSLTLPYEGEYVISYLHRADDYRATLDFDSVRHCLSLLVSRADIDAPALEIRPFSDFSFADMKRAGHSLYRLDIDPAGRYRIAGYWCDVAAIEPIAISIEVYRKPVLYDFLGLSLGLVTIYYSFRLGRRWFG